MKLTWADIEEHRAAATPAQWRRMEAYFRQDKEISRLAREDGLLIDDTPRRRNSAQLSLGRGCIAVLNSMLQRPVRVLDPNVLAQPAQTAGGNVPPVIGLRPRKKRNNNVGWIVAKRPRKPPGEPGSESSPPTVASSPGPAAAALLTSGETDVLSIEQRARGSDEREGTLAHALKAALAAQSKTHQT